MESPHSLKSLLQLQLASDSSAVANLPYILASLTPDDFLPSPHLSNWTTRINSLLYSKESGGRWAGLCLAQKTSILSKSTMVEFSQSWLGVALPILSRNEPLPTLKSAIRLVRLIFVAGMGTPEFSRQVVTPNVPKFTAVLIGLAEKHYDAELKVLIFATLERLVPLYPNLHRPSQTALSALSLRFLNGNAPNPTSTSLLEAASRLYAVLHLTGGKVGAANLWRKALDETIGFVWGAFTALRSSFHTEGRPAVLTTDNEPHMSVLLNLDRLRCGTAVLCDLLRATTHRPVQVPVGPLVKLITTLLRCSQDDKQLDYSDPEIRAMEITIIPDLWKFSCDILSCLAKCVCNHLTPNVTRLISYLTFRLERKPAPSQRLFLLTTIRDILTHCHSPDSPLVPTRLAKAVLPSVSVILSSPSGPQSAENTPGRGKRAKKRARGYEGDEVFKLSREVICPIIDDGKVLLTALEVMQLLLRNPHLSSAIRSLSSRVLLNTLLSLQQMSPASLSPNPSLHADLSNLMHMISMEIGSGSTSVMSQSLGLIVRATMTKEDNNACLRVLDTLLHPRVPPLVRSLPHVESLSLFRAEESQEESEAREALDLTTLNQASSHPEQLPSIQDAQMEEGTNIPSVQTKSTSPAPPVPQATTSGIIPPPARLPIPAIQQQQSHNRISQSSTSAPAPSNWVPPAPAPALVPEKNVASIDIVPHLSASGVHPVLLTRSPEEEEDEEMPAINLDSDSDGD